MMFGRLGIGELLIILLIVLVILGPKQLPKLSKIFGKSVKELKKGMEEEDDEPAKETPSQDTASQSSGE